jgi:DNA-binding transcriptional LysR family regulator
VDLKVTLEQWRALLAVVDAGGYAPAAEALDKSQSAISYAIQRLETALQVRVFRLQGRKAALTPAGEILYRRAQALVEEASRLESSADSLSQGIEAQLYLAVDAIFPEWLLLDCLSRFAAEFPETRVELLETVLSGTDEALMRHDVDLAVTPRVPPGFAGDPLMRVRFIPVAHPDHPLHAAGRPLRYADLRRYRQLVVRDSGSRSMDAGWLGAEQRWTMSHLSTSIRAACAGLGFAWYPEEKIREPLQQGVLKPLAMEEGSERFAELYLVLAEGSYTGPAGRRLAEIIAAEVKSACKKKQP